MTPTPTAATTSAPPRPRRTRLWPLAIGGAVAALLGLLLGLTLGGSGYTPAPAGLPDPGPLVGWGLPIAKLATTTFATLTLGLLVTAAFLMPGADRTLVSRPGRTDLLLAGGAALLWSTAALATIVFSHATVVGLPLTDALNPQLFWLYAFEVDQNVAYLVAAILAGTIAITALLTVRSTVAAVLTGVAAVGLVAGPLTAHGTGLGDHSLALTAGAIHALAAALWIGGLIAVARHGLRHDPGFATTVRRFSTLATGAVIVLAASGIANAYTRLEQAGDLFTTAYGVLVLGKIVFLAVLLTLAIQTRRALADSPQRGGRLAQWLLTEAVLLVVTMGFAISLTVTAYPRVSVPLATPAEELLGFPFPPAPSPATVLWGWYPDVAFLVVAAVLAGGYGWALWRARSRGVAWPWGRAIAWFSGTLLLAYSTSTGLAGYARLSVEWHMVQHMMLSMVVPILLVLGMPTTLLLRALRPGRGPDQGPREWLVTGLHSPVSRFVTHPIYVLLVATVGLFGLYLTPLFALGMSSHLGHILMGLHFLLAGYLFYWVVLGLDPGPREIPPWGRMMLLLLYVGFHAFFAVGLMMSAQPLGMEWFGQVQPPWLTDLVKDSVDGGGIAWGFGEIPALVVLIVVAVQWARSDDRESKRRDRRVDRDGDTELDAYNARLAKLAAREEARTR